MKYYQSFNVVGHGCFPIDMLRYDHCFPAGQEAASDITTNPQEYSDTHVTVTLGRYTPSKDDKPTSGRWASFGWPVDPASVRTIKL